MSVATTPIAGLIRFGVHEGFGYRLVGILRQKIHVKKVGIEIPPRYSTTYRGKYRDELSLGLACR